MCVFNLCHNSFEIHYTHVENDCAGTTHKWRPEKFPYPTTTKVTYILCIILFNSNKFNFQAMAMHVAENSVLSLCIIIFYL